MNNEQTHTAMTTAQTTTGIKMTDENIKVMISKVSNREWSMTVRYTTKDIRYNKSYYQTKRDAIDAAQRTFASYQNSAVYQNAANRI